MFLGFHPSMILSVFRNNPCSLWMFFVDAEVSMCAWDSDARSFMDGIPMKS